MEIGDEKVQFNVLEAMKHSIEDHSLFCIDLLSDVVNNCRHHQNIVDHAHPKQDKHLCLNNIAWRYSRVTRRTTLL